MHKFILAIGLWMIGLPFLGIPFHWKRIATIVTGALLILLAFMLYERKLRYTLDRDSLAHSDSPERPIDTDIDETHDSHAAMLADETSPDLIN